MAKSGFAIKQRAKMLMQSVVLPLAYRVGCIRKVDKKLVVFCDAHHNERPVSMDRLCRALRATHPEYHIVERYRDYADLGYVGQVIDAIRFMWLYATAGCVIICDNYLPVAACKKRKNTKVIQLWHGPGAYKRFGYDSADDIPQYYKGNVFKNYSLVTVSGEKCIRPFTSAMRQKKGIVRAMGTSRMDDYLSERYVNECRDIFRKKYPEAAGKKVVVWAPTFRGNAGEPRLEGLADIDRLESELGDGWCVIKSIHPHLFHKYDRADLKGRIPTEKMLPIADVFITDYSSILYDACIHRCKMLMFAPDLREFERARGTYMQMSEFPGEIITDGRELAAGVKRAYDSYDADRQKEFTEGYLGACDGHATERIIHYITKT